MDENWNQLFVGEPSETPYGSVIFPTVTGGCGGAIHLEATTMTLNGRVTAACEDQFFEEGSNLPGASGGSILVQTDELTGFGNLDVSGGSVVVDHMEEGHSELAGSGGHLALHISGQNTFSGYMDLYGGEVYNYVRGVASPGSLYMRTPEYPRGYLDCGSQAWGLEIPHGRMFLSGLGPRTAQTDDLDQDEVLGDPNQWFPSDLAGLTWIHEEGDEVILLASEEHALRGASAFPIVLTGEEYWGEYRLDYFQVNWDVVSSDAVVATTVVHEEGVIDIPGMTFNLPLYRFHWEDDWDNSQFATDGTPIPKSTALYSGKGWGTFRCWAKKAFVGGDR
jgi:hypothetical protein